MTNVSPRRFPLVPRLAALLAAAALSGPLMAETPVLAVAAGDGIDASSLSLAEAEAADPLFPELTEETRLEDFQWISRVFVIFADTAADPRVAEQIGFLERERERLLERDVVILVDNDARSGSALRERLRPRGFMIALVGKDGVVHLRRPSPRPGRELIHAIDKLPLRREEMRAG